MMSLGGIHLIERSKTVSVERKDADVIKQGIVVSLRQKRTSNHVRTAYSTLGKSPFNNLLCSQAFQAFCGSGDQPRRSFAE